MSEDEKRKLRGELLVQLSDAEQALNELHEQKLQYSEALFAAAKELQHLSTHPKYFAIAGIRSIAAYPDRERLQKFATEIGEAFQLVEQLRERKAKLGVV